MPAEASGSQVGGGGRDDSDFFRHLYDTKDEYVARREDESLEARLIRLEVESFKVPNLVAVMPTTFRYGTVVEIGCATGELIAGFPVPPGGRRIGFDISRENVACARRRHRGVQFSESDFRDFRDPVDVVVLSDVLEHVPDDRAMLRDAARLGRIVLINLPLEDNWLNRGRDYGPHDVSGHLRRYALADGLELIRSAGLECLSWKRVWVHETDCETERRRLRAETFGSAFSGGPLERLGKRCVWSIATGLRPIGRRMLASNLFACACLRPEP